MTDKITLSTVGNLIDATTAQATINSNFSTIQTAFDDTLSLDGTAPNTMESVLDMNSNQILNLPSPDTNSSPLRLQDLTSFLGTGTIVVGQTSVASIAALRNLPLGSYTTVNVLGYYTSGDGGGGLFYYSSSSSASGDGGTVITPNTGSGRWLRIFDVNRLTPKMFGAIGGTNDTVYVQTAINVINSLGGGTLWLDNVYTIGGAINANGSSIINLLPHVNIDGPGGLKLADNTNVTAAVFTATSSGTTMTVSAMTSGTIAANQFIVGTGFTAGAKVVTQLGGTAGGVGTYQMSVASTVGSGVTVHSCNRMAEMIGSYSPAVINDVTYKNVLLDYNGANNCASQTIWSFNSVATINNGNNVTFDSVRFRNNCGSNGICLGVRQATPTLSNATVTNCSFENDGDRVNTASLDYSTIFAICSGLNVTNNTFALGPTVNGAALEVYGTDINIADNVISGYYSTINIVAIASQTTSNVNFTGNTLDVGNGPTLWTLDSTSKLRNINIVGNTCNIAITAAGGPYFINATGQIASGSEIDDLNVVGNNYTNYNFSDVTRTSAGISVKSCQSVKITGNIIKGTPGQGILISNALDPVSIDISGNSLINAGYCNTSALKIGIAVTASGSTGTLLIENNNINPIAGYTMTSGINNALAVTSGVILNNVITGATTAVVNTGAGVSVVVPVANGGTGATATTGTGNNVLSTSPTLVTPALGTPTSGTLTACNSLPISGVAGLQSIGTWTPTDQSGAGLTFTAVNCKYTQIGNMVHAYGTFTFPSTANTAAALIGGLPVTVPNASYAATPNAAKTSLGTSAIVAVPIINTANFNIWSNSSGANVINSLFSTGVITVNICYPAT